MEGVGQGGGGRQESSTGQPRRWRLGDTIEDTRRESVTGLASKKGGGIASIRNENDQSARKYVRSQIT